MKTSWLFAAGLSVIWLAGEVASAETVTPTIVSPEQVATSQPLRQGTDTSGNGSNKVHKAHPIPHHGGGPDHDDVLQATEGLLLNTNVGTNFPGVGANGFVPPDTNMAVGPNHILQTVNSRYAIYDKSGALLVGPNSLSSLWTPLGSSNGCATNNGGDVVAQYDKLADRFIVTQLGGVAAPFSECIAISQTSDPAGAYWLYSFAYGTMLNDYPKFGVWPTTTNGAYLATYNLFANAQTFVGAQLCAYDRTKMLSGDPTAQSICYTINNDGGYLPADLDGSNPPLDGTPGYFLNYETTSSLRMYALSPNFANPSASTLSLAGGDIPVNSFSEACAPSGTCIPQQGTTQKLDAVGDRLMYRLAFRNFGDHEAIVVNHSVAVGSRVGVRWYELRSPVSTGGAFSLYQAGTFAPDTTTYRWMGSAAMDKAGNIALGYSASSGSIHPAIRYTGRMPGDPLGSMESEVTLVAGTGSQTGGISRWGDYTAMRIDPYDDCTFWYTNQYLVSNGSFNWASAFGSFKFATCNPPDFSISASPSSLTFSQGFSGSSTVTVEALNGFSGSVDLSLTGCPANATCTISTPVNPGPTATATLNVTTTGSTSVGSYTLVITARSAGSLLTTTVLLTVNPSPTFAISATPAAMTMVQVGTGTSTVAVISLYGFSGNVDLAVTGCPSGATCTLPSPVAVSATSTSILTIALSTSTSAGTYSLTITGTQGNLLQAATLMLTVNPAGTLTNVALPANGGVAVASSMYSSALSPTYAIDGNRKGVVYWNDGTTQGFPDWLEVDFNGTKAITEVDVFSVQDNYQSPVDPTSTMTFSSYGLRNFEVQYWTGSAWAPIPGGTVTNNSLVWRQFVFNALVTTKIRVFVSSTADGVWSRINEVEAYANLSTFPDFSISASPSALTLDQGENGNAAVTVTSLYGFSGNVDLAVTGCPTGATCSLSTPVTPNPTSTVTLTVATSASTSTGAFLLTINGSQAAVSHRTTLSLTVNSPGSLTNVALPSNGGIAVASSMYSSALSPAVAIDGNRKGVVYWNDGTQFSYPDWLEVDFNGIKALSEVDVFSVQDNSQSPIEPTEATTFSSYGLRNFEVQYWTGSAWAAVPGGTVTNNTKVWRKFTFAALPTSKIRILVNTTADGVWSRINEVEAYALASTSPNFLISALPSSLSVVQGKTKTFPVIVTALNGYNGIVDLTVVGCPSGATCTVTTPVTPNPTATSTLSVAASASTSVGIFPLTITGSDGVRIHSATITLTVNPFGTLTNVARPSNGGVALASSTYSSALAPANAIDGDRKGLVYWNDGTPQGFPDWLEIDFNETKNLSEIDVFTVQNNFQSPSEPTPILTFTSYGLRNFEVQYWTGAAWAAVPGGTVTNNTLVWRTFTFAPLATTKIRVLVTAVADGVWSRITEVEAYTGD